MARQESDKRTLSTGLMSSTLALTLASLGFMVVGLVRNKCAAIWYGPSGLGLFSQATMVQTVLLTFCVAGLVTGGRVVLSRPSLTEKETGQRIAWVVWVPVGMSVVAVAAAVSLSSPLARLVLGDVSHAPFLRVTLLGLPAAVAVQTVIASAQALGERTQLVISSLVSALTGSLTVVALMSTRDTRVGAMALVASPIIQLLTVVLFCPSVRRRLWNRPCLPRNELRVLAAVAGASLALGLSATLGDVSARSAVVASVGLEAIGRFQTASLLSGQVFSIFMSALSTSILIGVNLNRTAESLGEDLSRAAEDFTWLVTVQALAMATLAGFFIPLFFSVSLANSSASILIATLVSEPLRCATWVSGAALLPLGLSRSWLAIGLCVVATQTGVALLLAHRIGVWGLPLGYGMGAVVGLITTLHVLRRRQVALRYHLPIVATLGSGCVAATLLTAPRAWEVNWIAFALLVASAGVTIRFSQQTKGPLNDAYCSLKERWERHG